MKNKILSIPVYVYAIVIALLLLILFPRETKFRYTFYEGKPWKFGLLTAPFDFPIFKSEAELKSEKDSVSRNSQPYFQLNDKIASTELEKLNRDYRDFLHEFWTPAYLQYTTASLKELYTLGIVSSEDYKYLRENQHNIFIVFEDSEGIPHSSNDVSTVKSAYSFLIDNCPAHLNRDVLKQGGLNNYLAENLYYDKKKSDLVKNDNLSRVAPSNGMVQTGEKIIDRGEIIDAKTYNVLNSMKQVYEERVGSSSRQWGLIIGTALLVGCFIACFMLYLYFFRQNLYQRRKHVVFLLSLIALFVLLTEICIKYSLFNVYIIPYAIIPIAVRTFFDSRTAQMTHNTAVLISSLMVAFPLEFILIQFASCLVVTFALKDLTQRSQLIRCSFYILLTYVLVYVGISLFQEGNLTKINWKLFLYFGINFIFLMFTYSFIYMVEKVFGYISNVTLVELSDINTPVLRDLSETCPGTFQHSLQVSVLGSAAAGAVGANPQLVRTGAMYHDIGKMLSPTFFTENQPGGINPHDSLDFEESAKIIISHVSEGIRIAEKNGLPPVISTFIRTHHGSGKTKYFYNSFMNKYPEREIDEKAFTYPGPNPWTKETAILMMADSVEAASRSLKDYTETSIQNLVNKIIDSQIDDGLLNEAPLSFKDISNIKRIFIDKLAIMYHSRISYPEIKKN